ncbi:Hypothetical predicted protein [Cloeon dipterum]|uniref:Uncharacterized protein n=1 Tax=Cloeon dipterum TaxID=197152 RepID=A0A8S1CC21_9INSE|nr:Hypothetical predicted protein [Cloeon dipterum]
MQLTTGPRPPPAARKSRPIPESDTVLMRPPLSHCRTNARRASKNTVESAKHVGGCTVSLTRSLAAVLRFQQSSGSGRSMQNKRQPPANKK